MKKFVELKNYGQLSIDKVLFEANFPIIFTCLNEKREIFMCVCCMNNKEGSKWLIGKTNGRIIVEMLQDKITIRQLLLEHSCGKITVDYKNGEYLVSYDNSDWNEESIYLPKEDSYMYADDGEFDEEISYFSSLTSITYGDEYQNCKTELVEIEDSGIKNDIVDSLEIDGVEFGSRIIQSEVISTLKVHGKVDIGNSINKQLNDKESVYMNLQCENYKELLSVVSIQVGSENEKYPNAA